VKASAEAVLALLRAHPEGITSMDALGAGCGDRLAARIHEIKAEGHRIADEWRTTPNGARIKAYRLAPPRPEPTTGTQLGWTDSPVSATERVPLVARGALQAAGQNQAAASGRR